MNKFKAAAKWIAILVVAVVIYARYHDASEQITGLLFCVAGLAWALWGLAKTVDKQKEQIDALQARLWEMSHKQHIPAYEWDENIEPPKL